MLAILLPRQTSSSSIEAFYNEAKSNVGTLRILQENEMAVNAKHLCMSFVLVLNSIIRPFVEEDPRLVIPTSFSKARPFSPMKCVPGRGVTMQATEVGAATLEANTRRGMLLYLVQRGPHLFRKPHRIEGRATSRDVETRELMASSFEHNTLRFLDLWEMNPFPRAP